MRRKRPFYLVLLLVFIMSLAACSKKENATEKGDYKYVNDFAGNHAASAESALPEEAVPESKSDESITNTSSINMNNPLNNSQDKIIRRVNLEMETQEFDQLITSIDTHINQLGGYVESSNTTGRRYYSNNSMRYGSIVARIPKARLNEFLNTVDDISNVISRNETTENVTLKYVDVESHKKALEIEQERLLALLEKVETLEDIITLEGRLSTVRYELESYEAQLRTYDNLVEYSTVTMNIQEVERMTTVAEKKLSVWERIRTGFGDTMFNIGEGLQNFFVWFIVNLPYLLIWAVIIAVIVIISRRYIKKSKTKSIEYEPKREEDKTKQE
jgi:DNA-binding transcriptional MerR regulator